MKKTKAIKLVLITAALAGCNKKEKGSWENVNGNKVYVRSDSTAPYSRAYHHGPGIWFYAFRPYYGYAGGFFSRSGYYSDAVSDRSNFGTNSSKSGTFRGGFGSRSRSSS